MLLSWTQWKCTKELTFDFFIFLMHYKNKSYCLSFKFYFFFYRFEFFENYNFQNQRLTWKLIKNHENLVFPQKMTKNVVCSYILQFWFFEYTVKRKREGKIMNFTFSFYTTCKKSKLQNLAAYDILCLIYFCVLFHLP